MKEIIYKIRNIGEVALGFISIIISSIVKYKIVAIVLAFILSCLLVYNLKKDEIIYTGNIRFILKEKSGSGIGGVGGILGSFGIGGQSKENFESLLAFVKTQRLQQDILLEQCLINGDSMTLGDAIVNQYNLQETLNILGVRGFKFDSISRTGMKSQDFKKVSAKVGKLVTGSDGIEGLMIMSYDRKSLIISISASTNNEDLTISLLHATYKNLEQFYSNDMRVGQAKDLNLLTTRKDSIQRTIRGMESSLARLKDRTRGLVLNQDRTQEGRLMAEIQMNYELLGELAKSAAMAEYSVLTSDKGFLLLDEPIKPLFYGSRSFIKVLFFSILIGLFGSAFLVTIVNIFINPDLLDGISE